MTKTRSAFIASFIVTSLVGCAAETGPLTGPDSEGGKEDGAWGRSVLRKDIEPVLVPDDAVIGSPFVEVVAAQTEGASMVWSGGEVCVTQQWERDDAFLEHERCDDPDGLQLELLRVQLTGSDYWGWDVIYADFDLDGRTDAHMDYAEAERSAYDDDRDGRVDRLIEAIANLDDFVIEGYPEGWIPPERPANRILEDTDSDGYFDRESITGHDLWICGQTVDGEWACEEP